MGNGVAVSEERAALFHRIDALRGYIYICSSLDYTCIGVIEYFDFDNDEIGIRHWKIAAEAGNQDSLNELRVTYNNKEPGKEFISKEYLDFAYRACHEAQMEVKSEERVKHRTDESSKSKC